MLIREIQQLPGYRNPLGWLLNNFLSSPSLGGGDGRRRPQGNRDGLHPGQGHQRHAAQLHQGRVGDRGGRDGREPAARRAHPHRHRPRRGREQQVPLQGKDDLRTSWQTTVFVYLFPEFRTEHSVSFGVFVLHVLQFFYLICFL